MDKIRILLVEDHVVVRQSIHQFLSRQDDFEVVGEASDGLEAVELASQLNPNVIIMDVAMPNLNGIEATKRIKSLCQTTAVLALTAYDYDEYIFALLEAGAAGYLLKDVDGQDLVQAIRAVHKGDSVLHPSIASKVIARFRQPATGDGGTKALGVLSEREREVLKLAAMGMSNKRIASELSLSLRTVEAYFGSIFNKLGIGSRVEAVVRALKSGWFSLDDLPLE